MDFNEILNSTISGLIVAVVIALFSIAFNVLKKEHNKNKLLFWFNVSFYFDIFAIIYPAVNFRIDKCSLLPLSFGDINNLIFFIILIWNVICTITQYNNIKKYIKETK